MRAVFSVVNYPYIIKVVRNQSVQLLVINLCGKLERTVEHPEIIIAAQYKLYGTLGFYPFVKVDLIDTTGIYRILYLLVERGLVVDSGRETEGEIFIEGWCESNHQPGA